MEFSEKLDALMRERGISSYQMWMDTGIAQSLINDYRKGKHTPSAKKIQVMSKYLCVPASFLVDPSDSLSALSEDEQQLVLLYRKSPKELRDAIMRFLSAQKGE